MPSVDDQLRHAFDCPDEEWVRRAPASRAEVRARHRQRQVVRRGAVGALAIAALVVAVPAVRDVARTQGVEPAEPTPSSRIGTEVTPLEGTWTSTTLRLADVRAAARAAGAPRAGDLMLDQLPGVPFRVVVVVAGARLTTTLTSAGVEDTVVDRASLSVTGSRVELRPFGVDARTIHTWERDGTRLTFSFASTTETETDGVPGEAWQRLLYDSAPLNR